MLDREENEKLIEQQKNQKYKENLMKQIQED